MSVNPVDQAVISQGLIAAAREMGVKLIRSAYSPIVREASDCAAAILDRRGNVVAQAELIPMQLGSIGATFKPCAELFPADTLEEGDFYINNDPFNGGQHNPDVFLFSPIFVDGELVAFSATVAHHLDLGGGAPGLNPDATDVYQEGLIIPPSKYNHDRDWNGGPLERLIRANIRVPLQTIGDFNAQFAANRIGAQRVKEMCTKFGADVVDAAMGELLDYSERRMRQALLEAPDGVYEAEDALDDDGFGGEDLPVRVKVTIDGENIDIDFEGTCDQTPSNLNCPFASTMATALSVVKSVLTSPDIPFNEGAFRPVSISAPYGSILNPKPPAPVRARLVSTYRAYNAVMKALAQAVPEKVIACGFDTTSSICLSHLGEEGYRISIEVFGGGYGAGPTADGCDAVDSPMSNCGNVPVEAMDLEYDYFRVVHHSLNDDSGGAGEQRGGMGLCRHYEILKDGVTFATYSDRFRLSSEGLFGGAPGQNAVTYLKRDGELTNLPSKGKFDLHKGDVLMIATGGGGGYGRPSERVTTRIDRDLADGFISEETARNSYGLSDAAE
jgi:N-methylhydantoinase B